LLDVVAGARFRISESTLCHSVLNCDRPASYLTARQGGVVVPPAERDALRQVQSFAARVSVIFIFATLSLKRGSQRIGSIIGINMDQARLVLPLVP